MKSKIIILLLGLGIFSSCNSWLDVEPANQISKHKLYGDEIGFQNALNGVYIAASAPSLYGKSLSWGGVSAMAQTYADANDYENWYMSQYQYYDYSQTLAVVNGIWEGLYNVIANCNLLLEEIKDVPPSLFVLDTITKNVITGEALAMRAFCHLDLVRLYAPAPVKNSEAKFIPYQEVYPSELTVPLTTSETLDKIIADLLKAKDLVAYNDTIYNKTQMAYKMNSIFQGQYSANGGNFFRKRGFRFNYCAIIGLLSRAYLYKGDIDNALYYSKHFYDRFIQGNKWFAFNSSTDYTTSLANKQKKHLQECMFAIYRGTLLTEVESYYSSNQDNLPVGDVDNIFLNDEDDYRLSLIAKEGTTYGNSVKYREVGNYQRDDVEGPAIPILRMSEIYYTLIECYYAKGNKEEALRLLKEFRSGKGCRRAITDIASVNELQNIIINDARREYIGEAQLFYLYKRLNRNILYKDGEIAPSEEKMTFNVPDSQNM